MVRVAPLGSAVGFATHPSRFGCVPRTKTTIAPSSEMLMSPSPMPSSFVTLVSLTGANAGPAAV
jgi:hypothetical protein